MAASPQPSLSLPLPRRRLPIGVQSLAKLRAQDCYCVDKTGLAIDLIEAGRHFFLSRPRRFGKTLLVDTFKELFEGNQALFAGLAAALRDGLCNLYSVLKGGGEPIHLVGVEFGRVARNLVGFEVETLGGG